MTGETSAAAVTVPETRDADAAPSLFDFRVVPLASIADEAHVDSLGGNEHCLPSIRVKVGFTYDRAISKVRQRGVLRGNAL